MIRMFHLMIVAVLMLAAAVPLRAQHFAIDFTNVPTGELREVLLQVESGRVENEGFLKALQPVLRDVVRARGEKVGGAPKRAGFQAAPAGHARRLVEKYLRRNAKDPDSVEIAEVGQPVQVSDAYWYAGDEVERPGAGATPRRLGLVGPGHWRPIGRPGVAVRVRARGNNSFGAKALIDKVFFIAGGKVLGAFDVRNFSPQRPQSRQDPFTQGFLNAAEAAAQQPLPE